MGSKAFLFMGVLIFTALLFTSDQVIARDLAESYNYPKNEDGTIKPNGVGEAKYAYGRPFGSGNNGGYRGVGEANYEHGRHDPNADGVRPPPYGGLPPPYGGRPPYNRGGYP